MCSAEEQHTSFQLHTAVSSPILLGFKMTNFSWTQPARRDFVGEELFFFSPVQWLTANLTAFFIKILFKVRMHGNQRDTDHHIACEFASGSGDKVN